MPPSTNRRQFIGTTIAAAGLLPLSSIVAAEPSTAERKLKVLCIGAHPDDPETGCGGTLAKFAAAGHKVIALYLTRGQAGIRGRSHEEAAAIRTREAEAACAILKVEPRFFRQTDGNTQVNNDTLQQMTEIVTSEHPDIILAHWPIDSHRDHQIASVLAVQAWMKSDRSAALYFFEVCAGRQTMGFKPTDYVDITTTQAIKRQAVFCHESQHPAKIYSDDAHAAMEDFRGYEIGVKAGEAFVRLATKGLAPLI